MEEIKRAQEINYVEMTNLCEACDNKDDCKINCKDGVCKLIPKP